MKLRLLALIGLLGSLTSCASIVEGTDQEISFQVQPNSAVCQIYQHGRLIGTIQGGVGRLQVSKSSSDLQAECNAPGYKKQVFALESSPSGWGIAGCLIDLCLTDYATGALNSYDERVQLALVPETGGAGIGSVARAPQSQQYAQQRYQQQEQQARQRAGAAQQSPQPTQAVASANGGYPQAAVTRVSAPPTHQWRTVHSRVRAYWGMDINRDFFEMPNAVPLTLVKRHGQWGLFQYQADDGRPAQVWIALNQVHSG